MQLYDSCLVFLKILLEDGMGSTEFAIPSARVFASKSIRPGPQLKKNNAAGNSTPKNIQCQWIAWIPTRRQGVLGWTTFVTKAMAGRVMCEFLTNEEVDSRLLTREWNHTLQANFGPARPARPARPIFDRPETDRGLCLGLGRSSGQKCSVRPKIVKPDYFGPVPTFFKTDLTRSVRSEDRKSRSDRPRPTETDRANSGLHKVHICGKIYENTLSTEPCLGC